MSTLRQAIQSKIDTAQAQVDALKVELSTVETTYADWIDQEVEAFKSKTAAFVAKIAEHI